MKTYFGPNADFLALVEVEVEIDVEASGREAAEEKLLVLVLQIDGGDAIAVARSGHLLHGGRLDAGLGDVESLNGHLGVPEARK